MWDDFLEMILQLRKLVIQSPRYRCYKKKMLKIDAMDLVNMDLIQQ